VLRFTIIIIIVITLLPGVTLAARILTNSLILG
jgi:hypothetical protein